MGLIRNLTFAGVTLVSFCAVMPVIVKGHMDNLVARCAYVHALLLPIWLATPPKLAPHRQTYGTRDS